MRSLRLTLIGVYSKPLVLNPLNVLSIELRDLWEPEDRNEVTSVLLTGGQVYCVRESVDEAQRALDKALQT